MDDDFFMDQGETMAMTSQTNTTENQSAVNFNANEDDF